jgi:hypothetical protein
MAAEELSLKEVIEQEAEDAVTNGSAARRQVVREAIAHGGILYRQAGSMDASTGNMQAINPDGVEDDQAEFALAGSMVSARINEELGQKMPPDLFT